MPIYEYACEDCGHEFELVKKFSDKSMPDCERCSKDRVIKKLSRSAFMLKGGGWYKEGYIGSSNNKEGKTGAGDAAAAKSSENGSGKSTAKKESSGSSSGDSGKAASTGSSSGASKASSSPAS